MTRKLSTVFAVVALVVAAICSPTRPPIVLAHAAITTMPEGVVGGAYSQTLKQSGGVAPYTWSLAKGSKLPAGLAFDASTGVITGNPAVPGKSEVIFNVTDSSETPLSARQNYSIKIAPQPFTFDNVLLKSGVAGESSTQTLVARGGTPPYLWSVSSGSLPDGMKLDPATGVLSGTPMTAQTAAFTIRVTDSAAKAETGWQRGQNWIKRTLTSRELSAND